MVWSAVLVVILVLDVVGIQIEDLKMTATTYGLVSCSCGHPCSRCFWKKGDRSISKFLQPIAQSLNLDCEYHDYKLRTGKCSKVNSFKDFEKDSKKNRAAYKDENSTSIPEAVKERVGNVVKRPLLNIHDVDKHNGDGLHVHQGICTHFLVEVFKKLNEEEGDDDFYFDTSEKYLRTLLKTMKDLNIL